MEDESLKVLVCGGGNGAHCLSALAATRPNVEVRVLTLFADEAERWTNACESGPMTLQITYSENQEEELQSKPNLITDNPQKATDSIHVIFITVPAFAHESYLQALLPFITANTLIVGLPGQAGFEFQCLSILGEKAQHCAIASFESLPWACRTVQFGKHVHLMGFKETLGAAIVIGKETTITNNALDTIQTIFGDLPKIKLINNYIAVNLMAKSIVHPPMMYGKWANYDGSLLAEKPLFYQGIDETQASLLSRASDEVMETAKTIQDKIPDINMSDVIHIFDWYKEYYAHEISDKSCLKNAMRSNKAYDGLVHPMKEVPNGKSVQYVPDFNYRYLTEDIPFGLVVMKGIAEAAGVQTPVMDEIIMWGQGKLGKEYVLGNSLKGKDIGETRAPQNYGFYTLDDMFKQVNI